MSLNGRVVATRSLAEVSRLVLRGLAGNDLLDVSNRLTVPATP